MKEETGNFSIDAEKLLREKSWEQLTATELKVAEELFADKAEYERMRAMVHQLRSSSGVTDEELVPSAQVRRNLLDAFEDEQSRRRVIWWNSIGFWFRDRLRLDIPAVRFAVAGVLLIAGIFTVLRLIDSGDNAPNDQIVKNIPVQLSDSSSIAQSNLQPKEADKNVIPSNQENNSPDQIVPAPNDVVVSPANSPRRKNPVVTVGSNSQTPDIDTISQKLAVASGVDTAITVPGAIVLTNGSDPAVCCGAAISLTAPAATPAYNWTSGSVTPVNVFTVNGTNVSLVGAQPVSRSLAADEEVIAVFWSLR